MNSCVVHKARLDVQSNYILIALFCIDTLISCNICGHRGIYKTNGHAILISSRNFSVKTDRWAAAVDQLARKIASVTDTKRTNKRHERR